MTTCSCSSCGWEETSIGTPSFLDMPAGKRMSISVRMLGARLPAPALKNLRESSQSARSMTVADLASRLASGAPFPVGHFAEYQAQEVVAGFEGAGFEVFCVEEDAS